MLLDHQDLLNRNNRLFHISEQADLDWFEPRPSPSYFADITGDVVFAVSGSLLHNYLLPRDCPRVTWYAAENTTDSDKALFMANTTATYIIAVEWGWYQQIKETVLYCYEFEKEPFKLIDECAGYYVADRAVAPVSVITIHDAMATLQSFNIELRFMPSLVQLVQAVSKSSLNFSIIRMRNAKV